MMTVDEKALNGRATDEPQHTGEVPESKEKMKPPFGGLDERARGGLRCGWFFCAAAK
ncbi:hypothetical protein [Runella slithyformis]|uniref:hypothetical protein n=1 Tax=Runella slithyformis TaxID=106 RepID=UPI0002D5688A|nr:hypothetical protein [Runella slithyformis]